MRTYPSSEDVQGATFYYYSGRWIQFQDRTYSAQFPLPREHSLPSCLSWRSGKYVHNTSFTSYRVPIYTPGWRAAMWIKCLAEGQKCQAWTGIEPATLWSRVKGSLQYTTAPRRMKILCALLRINCLFQQVDTKIVNFDEGVLLLEPFFWGNVIFKICSLCIKSHVCGREEFLWIAPPPLVLMLQSYVMNASLYSCWFRFTTQEQTLYPGKPNNGKNFGT